MSSPRLTLLVSVRSKFLREAWDSFGPPYGETCPEFLPAQEARAGSLASYPRALKSQSGPLRSHAVQPARAKRTTRAACRRRGNAASVDLPRSSCDHGRGPEHCVKPLTQRVNWKRGQSRMSGSVGARHQLVHLYSRHVIRQAVRHLPEEGTDRRQDQPALEARLLR